MGTAYIFKAHPVAVTAAVPLKMYTVPSFSGPICVF